MVDRGTRRHDLSFRTRLTINITDNFIDDTLNAGQTGYSNTTLRITDEGGTNNDGVAVTGNYLIGERI